MISIVLVLTLVWCSAAAAQDAAELWDTARDAYQLAAGDEQAQRAALMPLDAQWSTMKGDPKAAEIASAIANYWQFLGDPEREQQWLQRAAEAKKAQAARPGSVALTVTNARPGVSATIAVDDGEPSSGKISTIKPGKHTVVVTMAIDDDGDGAVDRSETESIRTVTVLSGRSVSAAVDARGWIPEPERILVPRILDPQGYAIRESAVEWVPDEDLFVAKARVGSAPGGGGDDVSSRRLVFPHIVVPIARPFVPSASRVAIAGLGPDPMAWSEPRAKVLRAEIAALGPVETSPLRYERGLLAYELAMLEYRRAQAAAATRTPWVPPVAHFDSAVADFKAAMTGELWGEAAYLLAWCLSRPYAGERDVDVARDVFLSLHERTVGAMALSSRQWLATDATDRGEFERALRYLPETATDAVSQFLRAQALYRTLGAPGHLEEVIRPALASLDAGYSNPPAVLALMAEALAQEVFALSQEAPALGQEAAASDAEPARSQLQQALRVLDGRKSEPWYRSLLEAVVVKLSGMALYDHALAGLRTLSTLDRASPRLIGYAEQYLRLTASKPGVRAEDVERELGGIIEAIGPGTAWRASNAGNTHALEQAERLLVDGLERSTTRDPWHSFYEAFRLSRESATLDDRLVLGRFFFDSEEYARAAALFDAVAREATGARRCYALHGDVHARREVLFAAFEGDALVRAGREPTNPVVTGFVEATQRLAVETGCDRGVASAHGVEAARVLNPSRPQDAAALLAPFMAEPRPPHQPPVVEAWYGVLTKGSEEVPGELWSSVPGGLGAAPYAEPHRLGPIGRWLPEPETGHQRRATSIRPMRHAEVRRCLELSPPLPTAEATLTLQDERTSGVRITGLDAFPGTQACLVAALSGIPATRLAHGELTFPLVLPPE